MEIGLARTFLEVVSSGSFVAAAERLHLTQTAISARIHALETQIGRRLFVRNRAGARLTAAGERFQRHALALVQVWERARRQAALPPGREELVGVGGEFSLWTPLFADWLLWMRRECPDLALRAEVGGADQLVERVREGSLDLAVLYNPPAHSELVLELIADDRLVMATTAADGTFRPDEYVYVDWGAPFAESHEIAYPELANAAVSISLGPLALSYILTAGGAGYFRSAVIAPYLQGGQLRCVKGAPEFSYSICAVYSTRTDAEVIGRVREGLRECARQGVECRPA